MDYIHRVQNGAAEQATGTLRVRHSGIGSTA